MIAFEPLRRIFAEAFLIAGIQQGSLMMDIVQYQMKTDIGMLFLTASSQGLRGVDRNRQAVPLSPSLDLSKPAERILDDAVQQLEDYFAGRLRSFDVPLDVDGTPFQRRVWKELLRIPFGKTVSYRDIARRIGKPAAVRAVGGANGRNPVCIIVPCHRVVAADGGIGGYSGGLEMKRRLLALEGVRIL